MRPAGANTIIDSIEPLCSRMGVCCFCKAMLTFNRGLFGKEVRDVKAFENFEILTTGVPDDRQVLATIHRDEPCRADPASSQCACKQGKDDYLLRDMKALAVCRQCPVFEATRRQLIANWEEWLLAMQDVYN
jgi:hypothetical protein